MSELLDENVQLVENITMKDKYEQYLKRQPMPMMTACYFLTPTVESVNRLIADYRDKKRPMYNSCHLFFSSRLSDALLGKLIYLLIREYQGKPVFKSLEAPAKAQSPADKL